MAYASKELKEKVVSLIKDKAKEMNIKVELNVKIRNYSTLCVNIKGCSIDLKQNLIDTVSARIAELEESGCYSIFEMERLQKLLNENANKGVDYHENYGLSFDSELQKSFSGQALEFVKSVMDAIKCDYYDNSDPMTDYFDTAYYYDLSIGKNKNGLIVKS